MPDNPFSSDHDDDLPRTVRQQKAARERETMNGQRAAKIEMRSAAGTRDDDYLAEFNGTTPPGYAEKVTVTRLQLPFFHLMGFFIKAAFAAIPGLALFLMMIFAINKAVEIYYPWFVIVKIDAHYGLR